MAACACSQPDMLLPPSILKHYCHVDVDNAQHCQLVKFLQGVRRIITRYRSQKFTTKEKKKKKKKKKNFKKTVSLANHTVTL